MGRHTHTYTLSHTLSPSVAVYYSHITHTQNKKISSCMIMPVTRRRSSKDNLKTETRIHYPEKAIQTLGLTMEEYRVERILDRRSTRRTVRKTRNNPPPSRSQTKQYLIRWYGFPESDEDTWEDASRMDVEAPGAVDAYWYQVDTGSMERTPPETKPGRKMKKMPEDITEEIPSNQKYLQPNQPQPAAVNVTQTEPSLVPEPKSKNLLFLVIMIFCSAMVYFGISQWFIMGHSGSDLWNDTQKTFGKFLLDGKQMIGRLDYVEFQKFVRTSIPDFRGIFQKFK